MLRLEGLTKVYPGGVEALRGIDLEVAEGELLVVVGPSGCGKSTLLRVIAGLETASSGTVLLQGAAAGNRPPHERGVAMVFQDGAIYPHLSVRENLAFALRVRRTPREAVERAVREAAALVELEALLERRPATLSGGERHRVALGRAIAGGASVLLLDEPFGSLDARLRTELRTRLRALHAHLHRTIVHVTHDQGEALALADRVAVMEAGRLRQVGTPREVHDQPADRFVASFIGEPPMSLLEGTIGGGGRLRFEIAEGQTIPIPKRLLGVAGGYVGRPVVLGVRASSVRASRQGTITMKVDATETIAGGVLLLGRTATGAGVAACGPAGGAPAIGSEVPLEVDAEGVHLFEADEGGQCLY